MRRLQAQRLRAETHIILRWRAPASGCPSSLIRTLSSPKEQRKIIFFSKRTKENHHGISDHWARIHIFEAFA
jgi:hypothetical protein